MTTQCDVPIGMREQVGTVPNGIPKAAMILYGPRLRLVLWSGSFLTRAARAGKRKKYGKLGARRNFRLLKR